MSTKNGSLHLPKLPVRDYSYNVQQFSNQITNQVFQELKRNQGAFKQVISDYIANLGLTTGQTRIILNETTQNVTVTPVLQFQDEAINIDSPSIRFENVRFKIIGFSSAIVQITADFRLTAKYEGIDQQQYTQDQVFPFSTIVTVPGQYPANSVAEGNLNLDNLVITQDIDPSNQTVVSMTTSLFVSADIRIVVFV